MTIGVDLGGTNMRAGIERDGTIHSQRKALVKGNSLDETLSQFIEFIRPLVSSDIKGIGIGVPSVVDIEKGIVYNVVNIPSWQRVPLKDILEKEFGVPVIVNNDVNCFVLGEHKFGVAQGMKHVVGVSVGTGLGAGIIINNELFNGNNCGAGEVGMLPYLNHTIEYYVSGNLFSTFFDTTAEEAHRQALAGNSAAIGQWREFGVHMGEALKCVMLAYDPEAIVLGGSLSKAYELFRESMNSTLRTFPFPESVRRLKIFRSQNDTIVLLGAARLASRYVGSTIQT
jgi:glucokinase